MSTWQGWGTPPYLEDPQTYTRTIRTFIENEVVTTEVQNK